MGAALRKPVSVQQQVRPSHEQVVLVNPRRLIRLISSNPGTTTRQMATGLEYTVPAVMWVIRMLAREGIIVFDGAESADSGLRLTDILIGTSFSRAEAAGLELDLPLAR